MSYGNQTPYRYHFGAGLYSVNVEIGIPPAPPGFAGWIDNLDNQIVTDTGDKIIFKEV